MTISTDQAQNITELKRIFPLQKDAFNQNPYPNYDERRADLEKLKEMVLKYQAELLRAMSDDFGFRSDGDSRIGDFLTTIKGIKYCLRELKGWMKPSLRKVELVYKPAENYVLYQPVGVVGLLGCWNYPIFESFEHLAWILAAGCRCLIKGSEFVPSTNQVSRRAVAEFFDETKLAFIEGEIEVAEAFTALPFDHILVTGSPNVGKLVMRAASANLTPVTLELGGKCPLVIDNEIKIETAVTRFILGKTINAGQTCVAPDYVFCPENRVEELKDEIQKRFNMMYPDFANNHDWTSILNEIQYRRLLGYLDDARSKGAEITALAEIDEVTQDRLRKMPLHLLTSVTEDMTIMQEEIFGPLLPILTYTDLETVISYIQERPRPLALYINSFSEEFQESLLKHTHSGGVCINEAAFHVAQEDLPFGGIGNSGMGRIHGKEGFRTFSNQKAVFHKGKISLSDKFFPPFGSKIHKFLTKVLIR